ncbi:MAG: class F sortase [Patescibacteria group bacterium]
MRKPTGSLFLIVLLVSSLAVFSTTLFRALGASSYEALLETDAVPAAYLLNSRVEHSQTAALPIRLVVPSLSVDANIQQVGITVSGAMATPKGFSDVGWYKYGPLPGDQGSSVMAGHFDDALGGDGVFKHLADLSEGDLVVVVFDDGSTREFKVREKKMVPYQSADAESVFLARDGGSHLNLVTCGGTWVRGSRTYSERLIVFTDESS